MRRSLGAVFVVALLAQPAAAWDQLGADAGRTGVFDVPDGALDVVAQWRLLGDGWSAAGPPSARFVATAHGLTTIVAPPTGGACRLVHWSLPTTGAPPESLTDRTLSACWNGTLQGYIPALDRLAVCSSGGQAVAAFQYRDAATGHMRFSVPLATAFEELGSPTAGAVSYECSGVALDHERNRAIVPVRTDTGRHRIIAVPFDTPRVEWSSQLAANDVAGTDAIVPDVFANGGPAPAIVPLVATVTDTGIVVTAWQVDATRVDEGTLVAWLEEDGSPRGAAWASLDASGLDPTQDRQRSGIGAVWASAQTDLAATRLGNRVVFVDPVAADIVGTVRFDSVEDLDATRFSALGSGPVVWRDDTVVVPLRTGIVALDAATLKPAWSWRGLGGAWQPWNLAATDSGEFITLLYEDAYDSRSPSTPWTNRVAFVRLAGDDGRPVQVLSVPVADVTYHRRLARSDGGPEGNAYTVSPPSGLTWLAVPAGLLVVNAVGDAALLARTSQARAPDLAVSDAFPSVGSAVNVRVPLPSEPRALSVTVAWGDGTVEAEDVPQPTTDLFRVEHHAQAMNFTHRYAEAGTRDATFTLVFSDNTTRSATRTFAVGGTPPRELSWVQRQFEPENQDRTWGVIGVVLAALGAAYGLWFRRRRHVLLRHWLTAIDEAVHAGRDVAPDGLARLARVRADLDAAFTAGRLDDGQFGVLTARVATAVRRLWRHAAAPLAPRLSATLARELEAAVSDGVVTHEEAARLVALVDAETSLSSPEKDALKRTLTRLRSA